MRPHIRSSTEYRRRSSVNLGIDQPATSESARRRSVTLAQNTGQDGIMRRLSLALSPHADTKFGGDNSLHSQYSVKKIPGTATPFSLSSIILRRSSLPARMNYGTRALDRRKNSDRIVDPGQQELNTYRIKVVVVCFIIILVTAMLITFFRSSNK